MADAVLNGQDLHLDGSCGVDPLPRELVFERHGRANLSFPSKPDRAVEHVRMVLQPYLRLTRFHGGSMLKTNCSQGSHRRREVHLCYHAYMAAALGMEVSVAKNPSPPISPSPPNLQPARWTTRVSFPPDYGG